MIVKPRTEADEIHMAVAASGMIASRSIDLALAELAHHNITFRAIYRADDISSDTYLAAWHLRHREIIRLLHRGDTPPEVVNELAIEAGAFYMAYMHARIMEWQSRRKATDA